MNFKLFFMNLKQNALEFIGVKQLEMKLIYFSQIIYKKEVESNTLKYNFTEIKNLNIIERGTVSIR